MSWHDRLRRHVYWTCAIAEERELDRTGALALVWDELLSLGPYANAPRKAWLGLVRQYDQHRQQWSQWPPAGLARQYGAEPDGLRALIEGGRVATRKKSFEKQVQDDIDAAHAQPSTDRGESVGGVLDDSTPNPAETPPTPVEWRLRTVPLSELRPSLQNPRADLGDLSDLVASVAAYGVLQPIVVRAVPGEDGWEIVCGHRRVEASRLAGRRRIPVVVREFDDGQALEAAVTENAARDDMYPVDEARAVARLHAMGRTQAQLRAITGRSLTWVRTRLAIARLVPEAQALVNQGLTSLGDAAMAAALDADEQREWVQRILDGRGRTPAGVSGESRRLRNAPWPLDSERHEAGIVWAKLDGVVAPSCAACDRRTDAQQPLFGDSAHDQASHDAVCLGGRCWRAKVDAIAERAAQRVVPIQQMYGQARRFAAEAGVPLGVGEDGTIGYQADRLVAAAQEARAAGAAGAPYETDVTEWARAAKSPEEREAEHAAERERKRLAQAKRDEEIAARRAADDAAAEQLRVELRERLGSESLWIMAYADLVGAFRTIEPTLPAMADFALGSLARSEGSAAAILGDEPSQHATSYARERYAWLRAIYLETQADAPRPTPAQPPVSEPARDEQGRALVIVDRRGVLAELVERFRALDLEQPGATWAAAMLEDALAKCERGYDL